MRADIWDLKGASNSFLGAFERNIDDIGVIKKFIHELNESMPLFTGLGADVADCRADLNKRYAKVKQDLCSFKSDVQYAKQDLQSCLQDVKSCSTQFCGFMKSVVDDRIIEGDLSRVVGSCKEFTHAVGEASRGINQLSSAGDQVAGILQSCGEVQRKLAQLNDMYGDGASDTGCLASMRSVSLETKKIVAALNTAGLAAAIPEVTGQMGALNCKVGELLPALEVVTDVATLRENCGKLNRLVDNPSDGGCLEFVQAVSAEFKKLRVALDRAELDVAIPTIKSQMDVIRQKTIQLEPSLELFSDITRLKHNCSELNSHFDNAGDNGVIASLKRASAECTRVATQLDRSQLDQMIPDMKIQMESVHKRCCHLLPLLEIDTSFSKLKQNCDHLNALFDTANDGGCIASIKAVHVESKKAIALLANSNLNTTIPDMKSHFDAIREKADRLVPALDIVASVSKLRDHCDRLNNVFDNASDGSCAESIKAVRTESNKLMKVLDNSRLDVAIPDMKSNFDVIRERTNQFMPSLEITIGISKLKENCDLLNRLLDTAGDSGCLASVQAVTSESKKIKAAFDKSQLDVTILDIKTQMEAVRKACGQMGPSLELGADIGTLKRNCDQLNSLIANASDGGCLVAFKAVSEECKKIVKALESTKLDISIPDVKNQMDALQKTCRHLEPSLELFSDVGKLKHNCEQLGKLLDTGNDGGCLSTIMSVNKELKKFLVSLETSKLDVKIPEVNSQMDVIRTKSSHLIPSLEVIADIDRLKQQSDKLNKLLGNEENSGCLAVLTSVSKESKKLMSVFGTAKLDEIVTDVKTSMDALLAKSGQLLPHLDIVAVVTTLKTNCHQLNGILENPGDGGCLASVQKVSAEFKKLGLAFDKGELDVKIVDLRNQMDVLSKKGLQLEPSLECFTDVNKLKQNCDQLNKLLNNTADGGCLASIGSINADAKRIRLALEQAKFDEAMPELKGRMESLRKHSVQLEPSLEHASTELTKLGTKFDQLSKLLAEDDRFLRMMSKVVDKTSDIHKVLIEQNMFDAQHIKICIDDSCKALERFHQVSASMMQKLEVQISWQELPEHICRIVEAGDKKKFEALLDRNREAMEEVRKKALDAGSIFDKSGAELGLLVQDITALTKQVKDISKSFKETITSLPVVKEIADQLTTISPVLKWVKNLATGGLATSAASLVAIVASMIGSTQD